MFRTIAPRFWFSQPKKSDFFWTQVSPGVKNAEYAVRGLVPTTAQKMQEQIKQDPKKYPFSDITFCNIGNPQAFRQKPITFNRQVVSCMLNSSLIGSKAISSDASKRAEKILDNIVSAGSYTHSLGVPMFRQSISNFIARDDDVPKPNVNQIYMTEGASQGVHMLLSSMITSQDDAIMIPIPQYPLYSAAIALYGGQIAPYYLSEEKGWQLDLNQLEQSYNEAKKAGKNPKAITVINPGNPTGAIFSTQTIQKIIQFAVKNKLVVIADEVYRQNVYKEGAKFVSMRRVLEKMSPEYRDKCQLASLHSVSKGLLGECGLRGGYMYLHNFNPDIQTQLVKLKSINLCSNTVGQATVDLMCNPPLQGVSQQTKSLYQKEIKSLFDSLKQRAQNVTNALRSMKNIQTNQAQGAMYAFPSVKFSKKAIQAAGDKSADLFYCLQVLKNTGIALVPGSGFHQRKGTYHFRITTLILPEQRLKNKLEQLKKFNDSFHAKYE